MNRFRHPAILLCTLIAAAAPAPAKEHVWRTGDGYTVRADGLDLARGQDRKKLLERVEWASARVCRGVAPRKDREECAERAKERAISFSPQRSQSALRDAAAARAAEMWASR